MAYISNNTIADNGTVDLLAQRPNQRVAVEIETGKSDVKENLAKTLKAGFDSRAAALRQKAEDTFGAGTGSDGVFARAWSIGTTALWIALLLTAYVLFYDIDMAG